MNMTYDREAAAAYLSLGKHPLPPRSKKHLEPASTPLLKKFSKSASPAVPRPLSRKQLIADLATLTRGYPEKQTHFLSINS